MGYYCINKYKVFYSSNRFKDIEAPFLATLTFTEIFSLNFKFSGKQSLNQQKLERLRITKLKEDFRTLPINQFIEKWVGFRFEADEAQSVAWEILFDFLHLHKLGWLEDVRDFNEKLFDGYDGYGYIFPQGKIININLKLNVRSWKEKLFGKHCIVKKSIDLTKIKKIEGTLEDLRIETVNEIITLSNHKISFVNIL
jgi:hypothetical protein